MQIRNLYMYERADGGTTVSTQKPEQPYTLMYRIIADEGKNVTLNGIDKFPIIDTDIQNGWYEVDANEEQI